MAHAGLRSEGPRRTADALRDGIVSAETSCTSWEPTSAMRPAVSVERFRAPSRDSRAHLAKPAFDLLTDRTRCDGSPTIRARRSPLSILRSLPEDDEDERVGAEPTFTEAARTCAPRPCPLLVHRWGGAAEGQEASDCRPRPSTGHRHRGSGRRGRLLTSAQPRVRVHRVGDPRLHGGTGLCWSLMLLG